MAGNHKMAQIIWIGNLGISWKSRGFMKPIVHGAPSLAYKIVQVLNSFMASRFVLFSRKTTPPPFKHFIASLRERLLSQLSGLSGV